MKSNGVDAWLQHWLKMQKKGKRPLVLKDSSDRNTKVVDRRTAKKSKGGYIEPDNDEEAPHIDDDASDGRDTRELQAADGLLVPKSPSSVSPNESRRRIFLKSLSDDVHYKELLLLLLAAKVNNIYSVFTLTYPWIGR